jgi:hypothetical protein
MGRLSYTQAFARLGAKLANPRWANSAIAEDGSLVLSGWHQFLKPVRGGILRYEDSFSRWSTNTLGKNLLRKHLNQAVKARLPVAVDHCAAEEYGTNPARAGRQQSAEDI